MAVNAKKIASRKRKATVPRKFATGYPRPLGFVQPWAAQQLERSSDVR